MNYSDDKGGLIYIGYTLITATLDETRVTIMRANDGNWPDSLTLHGTALTRVQPLLHELEPNRDGWHREAERMEQAA